jgi:signal transduction histidine kinase
MVEYKLSNPLSIEERVQVSRLIGHDSMGVLAIILNDTRRAQMTGNVSKLKNTAYLVQHIGMIDESIGSLALLREYCLNSQSASTYFDDYGLKEEFKILNSVIESQTSDKEIGFSKNISHEKFLSDVNLIHSVLYNLSKNSFNRGGAKKVEVSVKEHSTLQDIVHSADGSSDYTDFIGFHVHDNGRGFPGEKDLKKYFTKIPENGEGFGLYFVGLAAKVLRGQIGIKSKLGNTTVSFYHPVYIDLNQVNK